MRSGQNQKVQQLQHKTVNQRQKICYTLEGQQVTVSQMDTLVSIDIVGVLIM